MTTEPEPDAAKGRRLVRDLFAARQAVVDAVNDRGLHATAESDAHFDRCESALADWAAETATPDARLRHALGLALSVINTMPRRSVEVTHVVGVCEAALRDWSEATSSPSDARLREIERASVALMKAEEARCATWRQLISKPAERARVLDEYDAAYEAWRKAVKGE